MAYLYHTLSDCPADRVDVLRTAYERNKRTQNEYSVLRNYYELLELRRNVLQSCSERVI